MSETDSPSLVTVTHWWRSTGCIFSAVYAWPSGPLCAVLQRDFPGSGNRRRATHSTHCLSQRGRSILQADADSPPSLCLKSKDTSHIMTAVGLLDLGDSPRGTRTWPWLQVVSKHPLSSVQSFESLGHRGDMTGDSKEIPFRFFSLRETSVSSSDLSRGVHPLIQSPYYSSAKRHASKILQAFYTLEKVWLQTVCIVWRFTRLLHAGGSTLSGWCIIIIH